MRAAFDSVLFRANSAATLHRRAWCVADADAARHWPLSRDDEERGTSVGSAYQRGISRICVVPAARKLIQPTQLVFSEFDNTRNGSFQHFEVIMAGISKNAGSTQTLLEILQKLQHGNKSPANTKNNKVADDCKAAAEAAIGEGRLNGSMTKVEATEAYDKLEALVKQCKALASDGELSQADMEKLVPGYEALMNQIDAFKKNETVNCKAGLDSVFKKIEDAFKSGNLTDKATSATPICGNDDCDTAPTTVPGEYSQLKGEWAELKERADAGEDVSKDLSALKIKADKLINNNDFDVGKQASFFANSIKQGLASGLLTENEGKRLQEGLEKIFDFSNSPPTASLVEDADSDDMRLPNSDELKTKLGDFGKLLHSEKNDHQVNYGKRFENFGQRIEQGIKSGQLTKKEGEALKAENKKLSAKIDRMKERIASGELSPADGRAKMKELTDEFSTRIFQHKHDADVAVNKTMDNAAAQMCEAYNTGKINFNQLLEVGTKLINLSKKYSNPEKMTKPERSLFKDQLALILQTFDVKKLQGAKESQDIDE
jgi:hypothetical protein